MEVVEGRPTERPVPAPVGDAATFFGAAAAGRLIVQRCTECGHTQHYPRGVCTSCGAEPTWEEAVGTGVVYTFTTVHQIAGEPFRGATPYVVAVVDLPEGVRMLGQLTHCGSEAVSVGMQVEAYGLLVATGVALVNWRPVS